VGLVIFSLVFILAGVVNLVENGAGIAGDVFGHPEAGPFSFGDAFYFAIGTIATVGYGDFSPDTELGKAN
jgi:hypothetical protein